MSVAGQEMHATDGAEYELHATDVPEKPKKTKKVRIADPDKPKAKRAYYGRHRLTENQMDAIGTYFLKGGKDPKELSEQIGIKLRTVLKYRKDILEGGLELPELEVKSTKTAKEMVAETVAKLRALKVDASDAADK